MIRYDHDQVEHKSYERVMHHETSQPLFTLTRLRATLLMLWVCQGAAESLSACPAAARHPRRVHGRNLRVEGLAERQNAQPRYKAPTWASWGVRPFAYKETFPLAPDFLPCSTGQPSSGK